MGLITRRDLGPLNSLTGQTTRTSGVYHPTDQNTGKALPGEIRGTSEFMHPSFRYGIQLHGPGLADSSDNKIGKG